MLIALFITFVVAFFASLIEHRLRRALSDDPINRWLSRHLYIPGLHMLVLVLFVLTAYPALFDHDNLPTLSQVLSSDPNWLNHGMTLLLIVALAAPVLPIIGEIPGATLPLQAIALTALLFHWVTTSLGVEAGFWPGLSVLGAMLAIAIAAAVAGSLFLSLLDIEDAPARLQFLPLVRFVMLLAQLPVILLYGHALGKLLPA